MRCSEVREALPAYAREREEPLELRRHLSRCPECRADRARYEQILEGLTILRAETAEPPAGLVPSLLAIPAHAHRVAGIRDHVVRNRTRYAGGAAVAAAGIGGVLLLRRRRPLWLHGASL